MVMSPSLWKGAEIPEWLGPPFSFLGLRTPEADFESARAVIVPAPYDGTTTFRSGTREGPRAILAASRELELYDEETETEAFRQGIATMDELAVNVASPREMVNHVRQAGEYVLAAGKLPVLLGGEHLLSLGMIEALGARHGTFTILHLDAHADLRCSYQGSPYSNACVMYQALQHASLVQVGIRAITREEHQLVGERGIPCFLAYHLWRDPSLWERVVPLLGPRVYISVDLDVFDPSFMPAVGTPEPGGLAWYDVLRLLRQVCSQKQVLGFDVMELLPHPPHVATDIMAARLVYKLLTYIFLDNQH
ncbi:MAG TPA: agmatinase [Syntrophobacteraceae bacterium]|nr:agmatinase [Syntrophobacteraceae bacterium]